MYRSKSNDRFFEGSKAFQKLVKEEKNVQEAIDDLKKSLEAICTQINAFKKQYVLDAYKGKLPVVGTTVIARRPELKKGFKVFIKQIRVPNEYDTIEAVVVVDVIRADGQSGKDAYLSPEEFVFEPIEN